MTARAIAFCLLLLISLAPTASAQLLGFGFGRAHPELDWKEIETEHFLIVYPERLSETAVKVASIAEQVYDPVEAQMELEGLDKRFTITITDEDQIVNGFALPGKMFLWVNQNDGAAFFSGTEKWLRKVIAHELQHNMWMEAGMDWSGIWSLFGTPSWFIEGLAEYETEEWGAYRSDLRVRDHVLRNREDDLDPHDSGFTMLRYMAETYGDSVITGAIQKRGILGLSEWSEGFKEKSGITVDEFKEEWRRVASAYTYAIWSQKERVSDVGEPVETPVQKVQALEYDPDASHVAVLYRSSNRVTPVLAVVTNDSNKTRTAIDHGNIDRDFGFSPDGKQIVYAKLHRVKHGGLLWDLKIADTQTGKSRWVTQGRRASHPHWSPAGDYIVFTAVDGETTNLYRMNPTGEQPERLTDHPYDVQILAPRFSPDGSRIAYSKFEPGRGVDIAVLDLATGESSYVTENPRRDLRVRWSNDGQWIYFTGDRNADHVPNIHRVPSGGGEADVITMTDVGEAISAMDVHPTSGEVTGLAYATVDTTRLRSMDPLRQVEVTEPVIDERLVRWRDRVPPITVGDADPLAPVQASEPRTYRSWRHMKHFFSGVLPSLSPWGVTLWTSLLDVSHKSSLLLLGDVGFGGYKYDDDDLRLRLLYGQVDTIRPPLWIPGDMTFWGGMDSRSGLRIYGEDLLADSSDDFGLRWSQPINRGEHLYSNHALQLWARYSDTKVVDYEDLDFDRITDEGLPAPEEEFVESKLELRYVYRNRRPHPFMFSHALIGAGLLTRFEWSDEAFGSDFNYRRFSMDASASLPMPFLNLPLMVRSRFENLSGEPPVQDFTGLRADPSIFAASYNTPALVENLVDLPDNYFLRGFPQNVIGERAWVTSVEMRMPILPPLPVSALGFSIGGLTGVGFYDQGRVWADGVDTFARHTVGWELRLPLRFAGGTLFVPAYGEGQTLDWEREEGEFTRDEYFMLAFTQGF